MILQNKEKMKQNNIKFRKADSKDFEDILKIYNAIHTEEENGRATTGWKREIYPNADTITAALARNDLFVEECNGKINGTLILNQIQAEAYKNAPWQYNAPDNKVMVMHTLAIDPAEKGK